jgi:hypothetical protein
MVEVEAGRGVALSISTFELFTGQRLIYRPITGTTHLVTIGIARATKGNVISVEEKFCDILREISIRVTTARTRPGRSRMHSALVAAREEQLS